MLSTDTDDDIIMSYGGLFHSKGGMIAGRAGSGRSVDILATGVWIESRFFRPKGKSLHYQSDSAPFPVPFINP